MSLFSTIGKGLKAVASAVSTTAKGAVSIAAGALGITGSGQPTIKIALETSPTGGVKTQATLTRDPTSPIPAGSDRTALGESNALGGNTLLLVLGGVGLLLLLGSRR